MRRWLTGVALAALTLSGRVEAQGTPIDSATIPDRQLFHRSDLYVAGAFVGATIALLPADRHLTSVFRTGSLQDNATAKHLASAGSFFGGPGPLIIGPAMYLVGRFGHVPRVAALAVHGTEAVLIGAGVADVIKFVAGRARPYATLDSNSHDFSLGRGFGKGQYQSFPSGHATAAFSAAAAVVAETHEWAPQSTWYVAPIMFGGATMVGLSRIYNDQHWASDVMMGAAIGTFAGLKTVRFNHTHAGNQVDRILLGARLVPTANGTALAFSSTF